MAVSARTSSSTVAPCFSSTLRDCSCFTATLVCSVTCVVPALSALGWETLGVVCDLHVQIALHDGDRRNLHVLPHHDSAGALIDHDDGFAIRLHGEALHFRDELSGFLFVFRRKRDGDQRGVFGVGDGAEPLVESFGDARGRGKIGALELQAQMRGEVHAGRSALHDGAIGNAAHGGMVLGLGVAAASGQESAQYQRALRHRVNLVVRPLQSGHEQDPALQAGRIAERRHGHIDTRPRLRNTEAASQ